MRLGTCYLAEGDYSSRWHLWIIVTEVVDGNFVAVSVTTRRLNSETLVCLDRDDHPFIEHPSVIPFRHARVCQTAWLQEMIDAGEAQIHDHAASDRLVGRIQAALLESDFTANDVKSFVRELTNPSGW
jgi:hypothetical protein